MNKKLLWIAVLIVFIGVVTAIVINVKPREETSPEIKQTHAKAEANKAFKTGNAIYTKRDADDGVIYSVVDTDIKADFTLGDNYFDTTITDMYYNPTDYEGKVIEIEGMYMLSGDFTFVGRYSTNSLCPTCPSGYSVMEFQIQGDLDYKFEEYKDWIKVIGTLEIGNDVTSNYMDYSYLRVISIEIMNERGNDTVNN